MYKQVTFNSDGKPYNYAEFICDNKSDVQKLPTHDGGKCAIGSRALVTSTKEIYVLSPQNEWVLFSIR